MFYILTPLTKDCSNIETEFKANIASSQLNLFHSSDAFCATKLLIVSRTTGYPAYWIIQFSSDCHLWGTKLLITYRIILYKFAQTGLSIFFSVGLSQQLLAPWICFSLIGTRKKKRFKMSLGMTPQASHTNLRGKR